VAAALGRGLVLEVDACHAGLDEPLHRVAHAKRVPVAGIGVAEEGDADGAGEIACIEHHLGEGGEAGVGDPEQAVGRATAGEVAGFEAGGLHHARLEGGARARQHKDLGPIEQLT